MTRWRLVAIVLTVAALAGALVVWFGTYDQLRPTVPTHWDIHGQPDALVSRDELLPHFLAFPGVMALLTALLWVLPWLSPKHFKLEPFQDTFDYIMAVIVAAFGWFQIVLIWGALSETFDAVRWLVVGIFLMMALMSNVIGQARRNFWLGVRTPWTLASEPVWIQTHRLAAWLWTPCSVVGAVAAACGVPLVWCFGYLIVYMVLPVPYSLILYKRLERQGKLNSTT